METLSFVALASTALLACGCGGGAKPPASPPAARAPAEITLLYTSDEHGWLLPLLDRDKGLVRGGAAEVLGRLKADEGHCVGDAAACPDPRTLLLSGGDNYTGPAISSYFGGEPMADAMGKMGYAAIAFGNHEFDFGRQAFVTNRARTHALYLAADVHATDPALKDEMDLPGFAIFHRRGAKIGVVGLATETTLTTAMASLFVGVAIDPEEASLVRAVPAAWAAGADAVVLIAHECPDRLVPILDRHPEFHLSFVGAGHCHKVLKAHSGVTPVISPGWRYENYVRVRLTIDLDKPAGQRARPVTPEVVAVAHAPGDTTAPVDAVLKNEAAIWQSKLDRALGEEIGYTEGGFGKESSEIARWIAGAYRAELKADVAIVNAGGIRQALPRGPITKSTVWSILPFDNKLVVCQLKGRDLILDLETEEAAYAGAAKVGDVYKLANGKTVDPDAMYTVATIDFLYHGGSGFLFEKQDPRPRETGIDWRAPLVAWMEREKTSAAAPLERRIDPVGGIMIRVTPKGH